MFCFVESRREMRERESVRVCVRLDVSVFECMCVCVRPRALFTSIEASKNRVSSQLWFG